uniref:Uncharacterized protein n=1 Tax=Knipowitschia caucasica TaxID=637954 RepID=A0AAV2KYV3_KNICA
MSPSLAQPSPDRDQDREGLGGGGMSPLQPRPGSGQGRRGLCGGGMSLSLDQTGVGQGELWVGVGGGGWGLGGVWGPDKEPLLPCGMEGRKHEKKRTGVKKKKRVRTKQT